MKNYCLDCIFTDCTDCDMPWNYENEDDDKEIYVYGVDYY